MIQQRLDMNKSTDLTQAILTDYYNVQEQVQTKQTSVSYITNGYHMSQVNIPFHSY
mgnify:CR=1 FL=1